MVNIFSHLVASASPFASSHCPPVIEMQNVNPEIKGNLDQ